MSDTDEELILTLCEEPASVSSICSENPGQQDQPRKRRREESLEWTSVEILSDHPVNPKWKCLNCGKIGVGGVCRIRAHILNLSGITACHAVQHRIEEFRELKEVLVKLEENKKARKQVEIIPLNQDTRPLDVMFGESNKLQCDLAVAKSIYELGLPLSIVEQPAFREMVSSISQLKDASYVPPCRNTISGPLLDNLQKQISNEILSRLQPAIDTFGATIVSDGWKSCKSEPIVNCLLETTSGTIFQKACNTEGKQKTGLFIASFIEQCILEAGEKNIVHVCMDGASSCRSAMNILSERFPKIILTICAAHSLNLMMQYLCGEKKRTETKMGWINSVMIKTEKVIMFFKNHEFSLALFRKYKQLMPISQRHELLKSGETRFASKFLMMERAFEMHSVMVRAMADPEWDVILKTQTSLVKDKAKCTKIILEDDSHWNHLSEILNYLEPIYSMLRIADSGGPLMSKIYGKMRRMVNTLESLPVTAFITVQRKKDIVEIVRDRWMYFHSPAHAAAYALDPEFRSDLNEAPHEIIEDLQLIFAQIYPNLEDQIEALNQFEQYKTFWNPFSN